MSDEVMTPALVDAYARMSALTEPACASCPRALGNDHRCCDRDYCLVAIRYAAGHGVDLETHPGELPLMGPNGCTCPPHFRPICTVHVCCMSNPALGLPEPTPAWRETYLDLREAIADLEGLDPDAWAHPGDFGI